MLTVYYGDDRVAAQAQIKRQLGEGYEVVEGAELELAEMAQLMEGLSLLAAERRILIKDLGENKACWEKLTDYVETPYQVVVWEQKIDKRSGVYKKLAELGKSGKVELKEFKTVQRVDRGLAFNIYDTALRNGPRAVQMLRPVEEEQDPYQMVGAWAWKAIDNYKRYGGEKEKRALRELSETDRLMKTATYQPWQLLERFLLLLGA